MRRNRRLANFFQSILDYENCANIFAIEYSRYVSVSANRNVVKDVDVMIQRAIAAAGGNDVALSDKPDESRMPKYFP